MAACRPGAVLLPAGLCEGALSAWELTWPLQAGGPRRRLARRGIGRSVRRAAATLAGRLDGRCGLAREALAAPGALVRRRATRRRVAGPAGWVAGASACSGERRVGD